MIKFHHNVGGLPDCVGFKEIIESLRLSFKDEVRKAGLELDIPEHLVYRQPFPGPGLGIRITVRLRKKKSALYRMQTFSSAKKSKRQVLIQTSDSILPPLLICAS